MMLLSFLSRITGAKKVECIDPLDLEDTHVYLCHPDRTQTPVEKITYDHKTKRLVLE